jgi:dihydrofolate reductase
MRKIVVTEFMSLDGVIDNPMWSMPYWNDEIAAFKNEERDATDALLLGRVTYEGFAAAWPKMSPKKEPLAPFMNSVRKYVVSNTLDKAEWNNSVIIKGDVVEAITKLKQEDGKDISLQGSAVLAQFLMEHDLVDGLRLLLYPVVVGKGNRLFNEGMSARFNLVESRSITGGVVSLIYEPARK